MIEVLECHEDVCIVVARRGESSGGMSEHLPETYPGSDGRDTWSVVDHTVLGKQLNDLVVEPVIDVVRIVMDAIDYLVLVDQPLNSGIIFTSHRSSRA